MDRHQERGLTWIGVEPMRVDQAGPPEGPPPAELCQDDKADQLRGGGEAVSP